MRNRLCVTSTLILIIICLYLFCLFETTDCAKVSFGDINRRTRRHLNGNMNQKEMLQVLRILKNENQDYETEQLPYDKRTIDLGLRRGFSGSQAAKHLLGLTAANLATGPGRRRRRRSLSNSVNI